MQRFWERIDSSDLDRGQHHLVAAAGIAAASLGIAFSLEAVADVSIPYFCVVVAVIAAAAHGGAIAACLTAIIGVAAVSLAAGYFTPIVTPRHTVMVAFVCLCAAVAGEVLRRVNQRERSAARRAMRREQTLQVMFRDSPAVTLILGADDRVAAVNDATLRLFGCHRDELIWAPLSDLVSIADPEATRSPASATIGGRRLTLTVSFAALTIDREPYRIMYVRDETQAIAAAEHLALTQRELHRISRAVSLGQLGSSIAHELNQPLSFAANYAGAAQTLLAADDIDREAVTGAVGASLEHLFRAAAMLRKLRGFVNRREPDLRWIGIETLVGGAAPLIALAIKESQVDFRTRFETAAEVHVDTVLIQQVILNLVVNAVDAVRGRDRREILLTVGRPDPGTVTIAVDDSGPGIAKDRQGDVFTPFQSSKPEGVGIGLAICRTIVEAHGGTIAATASEALAGARIQFTVRARRETG